MPNRYYRQNIAQYNPLSMDELAFAPMYLRQQHDLIASGLVNEQEQLSNYNALTQDQQFVQQEIDPINQEIERLSESLAREGYNPNRVQEISRLRQQRQRLYSPTGAVGIAQQRLQNIQEQTQELRRQYEDNPEISSYYINRLINETQGLARDEEGNIINRQLPSLGNVKHIPEEEIMKQINDVVKGLKPSDLSEQFGIQYAGSMGSFNDLFTVAMQQNVDPVRIQNAILSQLGPEYVASIQQYGAVQGLAPEVAQSNFLSRLDKLAAASSYQNTDRRFFNVSNDLALYAAKKRMDEELNTIPLVTTGGIFSPTVNNPLKDLSNVNGKVVYNKGVSEFDPSGIMNKEYVDQEGNVVSSTEAVDFYLPTGTSGQLSPQLREGYKMKNLDARQIEEKQNEALDQLHNLKTVIPGLSKLSDPEALEQINTFYKDLSKVYSPIVTPSTNILKTMTTRILGDNNYVGDIFNRQVLNANGGQGDWESVRKSLGYKNEADMIKNGKGVVKGVKHLPGVGATYEVNVLDSKGKARSIFVEPDSFVSQQSMKSAVLSSIINDGKIFEQVTPFDEPIRDNEGNEFTKSTYVLNNFSGSPLVIEGLSGIQPSDVLGKSKEQIMKDIENKYGYIPKVQTLTDITNKERENINTTLNHYFKNMP